MKRLGREKKKNPLIQLIVSSRASKRLLLMLIFIYQLKPGSKINPLDSPCRIKCPFNQASTNIVGSHLAEVSGCHLEKVKIQ